MKTKTILTSLLLLIFVVPNVFGSFLRLDGTLVSQTKQAVLIVAGKITDVHSDHYYGAIFTDVTITVSKVLKGKPNIDKNTVRFRIPGGESAGEGSWHSNVIDFPKGGEGIFFIIKRTWGNGWPYYDGLYPIMHPLYPQIRRVFNIKDGKTSEIARFHLHFYEEDYDMYLPVELAYRFIETAVKAPEEVSLLEEKIRPIQARPIQDLVKLRRKRKVESPNFLSMLDSELTIIEKIIKQRETNSANKREDTK